MRNTVPLLIDANVTTYDKLRLILLYVIQRGGISEENLAKLVQHAQIPEPQAAVVRNLAALGVPVLQEAGGGPVRHLKHTPPLPYSPSSSEPLFLSFLFLDNRAQEGASALPSS